MQLKSRVDKIDAVLPQTQCKRCEFEGCRPYAEAIVAGKADIDRCPPGGNIGIRLLADLMGIDPKPLNPSHGKEAPVKFAMIVENNCIGCVKCIEVCPVDAIIGTKKQVHTVIESECTGCELCIPACPVDCIELEEVACSDPRRRWMDDKSRQAIASRAKARHEARKARLERQKLERTDRARKKKEELRQLRLSKQVADR